MISNGHNKTAAEKAWLFEVVSFAHDSDWLRDKYSHITAQYCPFQIDHILGAKTKRKIRGISERVGELAIMPIPYELHVVDGSHPQNRTARPGAYRKVFGHEKQVWLHMIRAMQEEGYEIPFSEMVIQAIIR